MLLLTYIQFLSLFFLGGAKAQSTELTINSFDETVTEAINLRKEFEYDQALEMLFAVTNELEIPDSEDEIKIKAKANNEIANIFRAIGFYDDAIDYNQRAINLVESIDDELTAKYFHYRGYNLFKKVESQIDVDSVNLQAVALEREAYQKAIELYRKVDLKKNVAPFYRGISNTYLQEGNLDEAENWAIKARGASIRNKDIHNEISSMGLLLLIYTDQKKYEEALTLGKDILNKIKENDLDRTNYKVDLNLYKAYNALGLKNKALEHLEIYSNNRYSSEIKDRGSYEKINNQRLREKAKELEKRETLTENMVKKVRNFNIILLISLLTLGLLSFLYYRSQRLKEQNFQLLLKQKEQEAELSEQEAELATINAMMDGRETERKEIGQYLHDHVSALVNTANIQLEVLASEANLQTNDKLNNTQFILDDIADKVRSLSHQLLSNVLHKYGLAIALDDLCTNLSGSKIAFKSHSTLPEGKRYRESIENKLYSVLQELCNNILKHSQATEANIYLFETDTHFHLKIIDNGIGITQEDIKRGGVGLHQVKVRISSMGGTVQIFEGKPTTIKLSIPLGIANKA